MNEKYDSLFWWFEENLFEHKYDVPRKTSLALEFREWVKNAEELGSKLEIDESQVELCRQEMLQACDEWLK